MIHLRNIHKSFDGRPVLRGLDLRIAKGESLVIVGASGTGKSVTLKHMVGLVYPDEGSVLIDGQDMAAATRRERVKMLRKFGMVFQSGALINWMTVFENVALPLYENTRMSDKEIAATVHEKLAMVDLAGSEKKKPSEISGGMKKRVSLARAIVAEPDILLYDEPTSGLDPVMSRRIDQLILSLQKKLGVTSVIVTHDLHSAFSVGDRIAMLVDGQVAELAPPQKFAQSSNKHVQEFVHAQFETGKVKGMTS